MFGLPLVLPALRVAALIGGAAFLLGVTRALARILANVAARTALLRLFGCRRMAERGRQKQRGECSNEPTVVCTHDAFSRRRVGSGAPRTACGRARTEHTMSSHASAGKLWHGHSRL
ncbi:hypothetical protein PSAC2689_140113 [Paraburkholderia sacchari]